MAVSLFFTQLLLLVVGKVGTLGQIMPVQVAPVAALPRHIRG